MNQSEESGVLSNRERQILVLAAKGLTDAGIAQKLGISVATVGTYWGRIRGKSGQHSRTELVANFMRDKASHSLDELRRENERLTQELAQKAKVADTAKATLDLLKRVLSSAPDAIMLINEQGIIEYANEEAERLFGYGHLELNGQSVALLVPKRFHGVHVRHRARYMSNPSKRRMGDHYGTSGVRKDGSEFLTVTTLSAVKTASSTIVTVFIRALDDTSLLDS
ncbi:MAG: PAS domain S-box protein [Armatimonadetes bacterium]|nr:PAS domain S-box protein [Armatimonadota bacterium]MBS1726119.1 PAS domain S-box protein [Armatimonadota bacterium]